MSSTWDTIVDCESLLPPKADRAKAVLVGTLTEGLSTLLGVKGHGAGLFFLLLFLCLSSQGHFQLSELKPNQQYPYEGLF